MQSSNAHLLLFNIKFYYIKNDKHNNTKECSLIPPHFTEHSLIHVRFPMAGFEAMSKYLIQLIVGVYLNK